jgi:hypothetical protein
MQYDFSQLNYRQPRLTQEQQLALLNLAREQAPVNPNAPIKLDFFDFLDKPTGPIPVVGNALTLGGNILSLPADVLAALYVNNADPMSETGQIARKEGALAAWNATGDVNPFLKIAGETALAAVAPGTAVVGPFRGLTRGIGKLGISGMKRAGKALPNVPYIGRLFQMTPQAKLTLYNQQLRTLMEDIYGNKVDPRQFVAAMADVAEVRKGNIPAGLTKEDIISRAQNLTGLGEHDPSILAAKAANMADTSIRSRLDWVNEGLWDLNAPRLKKNRQGQPILNAQGQQQFIQRDKIKTLLDYAYKVDPTTGQPIGDPSERFFLHALPRALTNAQRKKLGIKFQPLPQWLKTYGQFNSGMREAMMSSGFTWMGNATDIAAKTKIQGEDPVQIAKDFLEIRGNPTATASDVKDLMGQGDYVATVPHTLGAERENVTQSLIESGGPLGKAPYKVLGGVGAIAGLASGQPILGPILGALQMMGAKAGLNFNLNMMSDIERAARERYWLWGAQDLTESVATGNNLRHVDDFDPELVSKLRSEFGSMLNPQQADAFKQYLASIDYKINPQEAYDWALRNNAQYDQAVKLRNQMMGLRDAASDYGVNWALKTHFPYTHDIGLTSIMRNFTPFPVWPIHNIPYYSEQLIKNPILLSLIANYKSKSDAENEKNALTNRFNMRLPIVGGLWANPLAPLSITSQVTEPMASPPGASVSGIDTTNDLLATVGLGFNPAIQLGGQLLGISDQGRDAADVIPLSRFFRGIGQTLTGGHYEPEAIIKNPIDTIRSSLNAESIPTVSYNEYLVRKKLAEMSLSKTGQTWENNADYIDAVSGKNPNNPLRIEATRSVGAEQAALFASRRVLPLQLSFLPEEEKLIRSERETLPDDLPPALWQWAMINKPTAFGYQGLSQSPDRVVLRTKDNYYKRLNSASRDIFLRENPDYAQYVAWSNREHKLGRSAGIDKYLQQKENQ